VILHTGASPVFADIGRKDFNIDPGAVERALTPRTKAVIAVDVGGWPCDYDEIKGALEAGRTKYSPARGTRQEDYGRPVFIADAAHSLGAVYKGKKVGLQADFTVFSFHAVKNVTTAEGGAVMFGGGPSGRALEYERILRLLSLHGQDKDALAKLQMSSWRYSIEVPGYKCNMPDIEAAIGVAQLKRYGREMLPKRKSIARDYFRELSGDERLTLPPLITPEKETSYHLFQVRLKYAGEKKRDWIIDKTAGSNIALNVHYIPVVMHPAYARLGYDIRAFPNSYHAYEGEISLPLYSSLPPGDAVRVAMEIKKNLDVLEGITA
jgi:dTDP-4-amino-4,6-dideoxygalactose transaminase